MYLNFVCFRIGGFNGKAVVPYGGESSHRFQDKGKYTWIKIVYHKFISVCHVNKILESQSTFGFTKCLYRRNLMSRETWQ